MKTNVFSALAVSSMLCAGSAYAATVTTTATAEVNYFSNGIGSLLDYSETDTQTTTATAEGLETKDFNTFDPDSASATQNADGTSQITGGGAVASGQSPAQYIGEARQVISETNMTGGEIEYSYDFALTNMSFYLNGDFGGANSGPNPFESLTGGIAAVGARMSYDVLLNGVNIFSAGIEAFGGSDAYAIANANNTSASIAVDPINDGVFASIDDIVGSLDLGAFADGETFTVETVLRAEGLANGFENIVGFTLGDPAGLNAGAVVAGAAVVTPPVSAVPLPAAGWMLLAGLGGLGALRRSRKG